MLLTFGFSVAHGFEQFLGDTRPVHSEAEQSPAILTLYDPSRTFCRSDNRYILVSSYIDMLDVIVL